MGITLKDKKSVKNKNGNASLFVNLVLVVALLVSIWTNKGNEIISKQLDLKNLLILLVTFNTLLLFKDFIISTKPSKKDLRKLSALKKRKSLNPLRALVNSSLWSNPGLLQNSVTKLKDIAECDYVELSTVDNSTFTTLVSAGTQPQLLAGTRLTINNGTLFIKHSGQIGSEEIAKISDDFKPIKFKSSLTRLHLFIAPLNLSNARYGFCIFYNSKAPYSPKVSLDSVSVFFESLISGIENAQTSQSGYKDKETGLILYKNYEELVDNELERSERYEQEMSLLTIKITDFDKLDNSEKPLISKNIASAMKHSLRRFDLMFYGKEPGSYYALLTESGVTVSEGIARRLQKEFNKLIKKLQLTDEKKPMLVIGSATYQADATHSVGLIEKSADACASAIDKNIDFKSFSEAQKPQREQELKGEHKRRND